MTISKTKARWLAIDTKTHQVVNRWPIAPGEEASGMAIDVKNHRLFLGCDNKLMVMMDNTSGKVLATVPIGEGVDAARLIPAPNWRLPRAATAPRRLRRKKRRTNSPWSKRCKPNAARAPWRWIPTTHKIYLATAKFEAPAEGERRGRMVPGTFKILVYGMEESAGK